MSTLFRSRLLLVLGMLAPVMLALQLAECRRTGAERPPAAKRFTVRDRKKSE